MLTLLFWLMMHGQAKVATPQHEWLGEQRDGPLTAMPPKHKALAHKKKPHGYVFPPLTITSPTSQPDSFWYNLDASLGRLPAPVEHVIEIRTKRVRVSVLHYGETCPSGSEAAWLFADADVACTRVTRELWIDNVKFGIIKGLD